MNKISLAQALVGLSSEDGGKEELPETEVQIVQEMGLEG